MFSNLLMFLDIWTTAKDADDGTANTITIEEARGVSLVYMVLGIVSGPFVHRKLGFAPLF